MNSKVNVITAGPSAGKSSTLRHLSSMGYVTYPEAASIFIHQKISEGYDPEEVRSKFNFQKELIKIDKKIENNITENENVFLDRSLIDNIAYLRHNGKEIPEIFTQELMKKCKNDRYENIFLLERLEFEDDVTRNEDEKEAREIHEKIRNTYMDFGYKVKDIPVVPIDKRADLIIEEI